MEVNKLYKISAQQIIWEKVASVNKIQDKTKMLTLGTIVGSLKLLWNSNTNILDNIEEVKNVWYTHNNICIHLQCQRIMKKQKP